MFEVHQVKVNILGIPKFLQQWENVDINKFDIYYIYIYIYIYRVSEKDCTFFKNFSLGPW
jgi:hypothetical protein